MEEKKVLKAIEELLAFAEQKLFLDKQDVLYARNQLLEELNLSSPEEPTKKFTVPKEKMIEPIMKYAIEDLKKFEDTPINRIAYEAKIFGLVTPSPSNVSAKFDAIACNSNTEQATEYLFDLAKNTNYVRMVDIEKDIKWEFEGSNGRIAVSINLSKPEKDPKDIAKAKTKPQTDYPKCALCKENLGFQGGNGKAARQTIRLIQLPLANEEWYLQYSPYQYYDHHLIALKAEHEPMEITKKTFIRLLDFVDMFPHFFLGSNAALPIVGGSILSHEHYQGGAKVLPMLSAAPKFRFESPKFKTMKISILDWYNSAIRIESDKKDDVIAMAEIVLKQWQKYSNPDINIIDATKNEPHNSITPVARLENGIYIIDIILRNNRTDKEHPYGIFHPAERLHNIKKEGIGIIEAMGLFILPGRLKEEINEIKKYFTHEENLDMEELLDPKFNLNKHSRMILELAQKSTEQLTDNDADALIRGYINRSCEEILNTTAVFKQDAKGEEAFNEFMLKNLKLLKAQ